MVFVTGGTGLIGSHLLLELVRSGKEVKALKRETSNLERVSKIFAFYTESPSELFAKIQWIDGDLLDYTFLENELKGIEEIYHCSGMVSFRSSDRKKMIKYNVDGTANLVNAALACNIKRFCHVSSVAALGKQKNGTPVTEETAWIPSKKNSGYSESKFFSEMEVWRGIEEGLPAVIVNPSTVIGPGDWNRSSPRLFLSVWKGMKFYTKGSTGFIGIGDVVSAIIMLMHPATFERCKNKRFLLVARNLKYRDLFTQIALALQKSPPVYFASNFMLEIAWRIFLLISFLSGREPAITKETVAGANNQYYFDGSKITRETGLVYGDISKVIKETAAFFLRDYSN